jgi:hypothetical protein
MVPDTNLGSKGNNARNGLGYHRTGSAVDKAPISIGPYLVEHRQVKMSMSVNKHNNEVIKTGRRLVFYLEF